MNNEFLAQTIVNPKQELPKDGRRRVSVGSWCAAVAGRLGDNLHRGAGFEAPVRHRQSAGACSRITISLGVLRDRDGRPESFGAVPN